MNRKILYPFLIGVSGLLAVLAAITLFPKAAASSPNLLGYKSVCTFSPVGTLILCWLAGIVCTIRARVKDGKKIKEKPAAIIALSILFAAGISFYSIQYVHAKTGFSRVIRETKAAAPQKIPASGEYSSVYSSADITADVSVVVADGKIIFIRLNSGKNIDRAVSVQIFNRIMVSQNPEVDSVSGATASSLVLMKAVEKALNGEE